MQSFSTAGLPPQERLAFWNEVAGNSLTRMAIDPVDRGDFSGSLHCDSVGALMLGVATSTRSVLRRTPSLIARSPEQVFLVHLSVRGAYTIEQGGREDVVREGDFTITDSTEPFTIRHHGDCAAGVFKLPLQLVKRYLPGVQEFGGRAVSSRTGSGALASDTLTSLCRQMERGLCGDMQQDLVEPVTALVAGACMAQYGRAGATSGLRAWRRVDIRRYIESHLGDEALCAQGVARRFRISDRHLRNVFGEEGEGVAAYILRRRLEECARQLRDPAHGGCTVSQIAFGWGFNSLGSFDRSFKRHFGATPQVYRRG